jgi:D-alanyl-D-alanine carboxypeptidase (penicillin-binding protein 5/6)
MSQAGYSSMFIMVNDEISVENLLRGIIVASGNDACVALAEGIAGTEENFVSLMNEKAQEIGMDSTNFANSSGINNPDNYSRQCVDVYLFNKKLSKLL